VKARDKTVNVGMILSGWRQLGLLHTDEAVKEICREITYRRHRRSPEVVDKIMLEMNLEEYPLRCLVAVLLVTAAMTGDLYQREDFKQRVLAKLAAEKGETFARDFLQGL
jgi:hypothetical protein